VLRGRRNHNQRPLWARITLITRSKPELVLTTAHHELACFHARSRFHECRLLRVVNVVIGMDAAVAATNMDRAIEMLVHSFA